MIRTWVACGLALALSGCPEGPPGPQGEQGEQGERGPAGADGIQGEPGSGADGLVVVQTVECQTADAGLVFVYQAVWFTNGGALVNCSILDGNMTQSFSKYYDAMEGGGVFGTCLLAYDAEQDLTGGYWEFGNTEEGPFMVTYNDDSSALDGTVVTFAGPSASEGGCTAYAD